MPWVILDIPDEVLADLPKGPGTLLHEGSAQGWILDGLRTLGSATLETLASPPSGLITPQKIHEQQEANRGARETYLREIEEDLRIVRDAYPIYKADGEAMEAYVAACHAYGAKVRAALARATHPDGEPSP